MIHSTAIISPEAKLGNNIEIGPFTIIHPNVIIGANSIIESHCEIGLPTPLSDGSPLVIGENSHIRSHSEFYEGSCFGPELITGHRVTVREKTQAGLNLKIGTLTDIQGTCRIGDYVRAHSNVHVGQATEIGNFVWIFPYVVFTNDPHPPSDVRIGANVGDFSAIGTMSVILPGVTIGEHSLVGANSRVARDVESYSVVSGNPAKYVCNVSEILLRDGSGRQAYPWPTHFRRGYPLHIQEEWDQIYHPKS